MTTAKRAEPNPKGTFSPTETRGHASPGVAPRIPYYKKSNSSGCCGGPHGNNLSDQAFRVHCIPEAYIHTLKGCDVPGTPDITDWFSCGPPSTKHSLLISASQPGHRIPRLRLRLTILTQSSLTARLSPPPPHPLPRRGEGKCGLPPANSGVSVDLTGLGDSGTLGYACASPLA